MFWALRGGGRKGIAFCALSAIDIALWDLKAKHLNLPLFELLGACVESVPVYGSGGWTNQTADELLAEMTEYATRGFGAVKMKVGKNFGKAERDDVRRVEEVRAAIGDTVDLYVDANNAYQPKQAVRIASQLQPYRVGWFEEPVIADDIDGLAAVTRASPIPVATGEHEYTKFGFRELLSRHAADIVQPDVGRVGGITEWMKIAHLAQAFNVQIAPHSYLLIHLHLACATPNTKSIEMLGAYERIDRELFARVPEPREGMLAPLADAPGLGLELDPVAVRVYGV